MCKCLDHFQVVVLSALKIKSQASLGSREQVEGLTCGTNTSGNKTDMLTQNIFFEVNYYANHYYLVICIHGILN